MSVLKTPLEIRRRFGRNFHQTRTRLLLTQMDTAIALDVQLKTIQRWEHGDAYPSMRNLRRISETFGVPIQELREENHGDNASED